MDELGLTEADIDALGLIDADIDAILCFYLSLYK